MKKESNNLTRFLNIFGILVVISCVFATGYFVGQTFGGGIGTTGSFRLIGSPTNEDITTLDFNLFWDVWRDVQMGYVEADISEEDMFYGAIKGLVDSIGDPVTVFLSPEENEEYLEGNEGKFEGQRSYEKVVRFGCQPRRHGSGAVKQRDQQVEQGFDRLNVEHERASESNVCGTPSIRKFLCEQKYIYPIEAF